MSQLQRDRHDQVTLVTLNRPEKRNALSNAMLEALVDAVDDAASDGETRVLVIAGAGSAWCAGVDLDELASGIRTDRAELAAARLRGFPKPTVAAIHGACVTGGLELALACDLRLATPEARFADTHSRVGAHPGWGMTVTLPRAVGISLANDMAFTGDYIDAEAALRCGLVSRVLPQEGFLDAVLAIASGIAAADPRLVASLKALANDLHFAAGYAREAEARRLYKESTNAGAIAQRRAEVIERGRSQLRSK
jgi:enoyl-CoA hydratase